MSPLPFWLSSNLNLSRAIFTAIFNSSLTQISRCALDVLDEPVAAIFDFVRHTLLKHTQRYYCMLTAKAQGTIIPDPSIPDAIVCSTWEAWRIDQGGCEIYLHCFIARRRNQ